MDIKIVRDLNTGKVNFKTKKDVMLDYQTSVKLLKKFNIKVH